MDAKMATGDISKEGQSTHGLYRGVGPRVITWRYRRERPQLLPDANDNIFAIVLQYPTFEMPGNTTYYSAVLDDFTHKVVQIERDIKTLAGAMGVPRPGFVVLRNGYDAFVISNYAIASRNTLTTIYLGAQLVAQMDITELKAILAHELAHVKRGDCDLSVRGVLASYAPFPFSLIINYFKRKAELECDAIASAYVPAHTLALALLKMRSFPYTIDGGGIFQQHPSFVIRLRQLNRLANIE